MIKEKLSRTHKFIALNSKSPVLVGTIFVLLLLQTTFASRTDHITRRDEKTFRVTVTTTFQFPKNSPYTQVNVSHSLPVARPWSKGERRSSGRNIQFQPAWGRTQFDSKAESAFIDWLERVPRNGGSMTFQTTYETTSVTRELNPEASQKARWRTRRVTKTPEMHPEIIEKAEELIQEPTPIEALTQFSQWLTERVRYDASLANSSVDETLLHGAGHCGHRAGVLRQFCAAIGIPMRSIAGANLRHTDGGIDRKLFKTKATYSNQHVWAELEIPGLGWVELEPAGKERAFQVPASYIQTRGLFQNFRVKLMENGKWINPKWEGYDDDETRTTYLSDIGLSNVITFVEIN
jgi:transglutaminase-like putative cysteine protease